MLTQRISALAHDLARECHVGSSSPPGEKSPARKATRDTSHRYSITRRREWHSSCVYVSIRFGICNTALFA